MIWLDKKKGEPRFHSSEMYVYTFYQLCVYASRTGYLMECRIHGELFYFTYSEWKRDSKRKSETQSYHTEEKKNIYIVKTNKFWNFILFNLVGLRLPFCVSVCMGSILCAMPRKNWIPCIICFECSGVSDDVWKQENHALYGDDNLVHDFDIEFALFEFQ